MNVREGDFVFYRCGKRGDGSLRENQFPQGGLVWRPALVTRVWRSAVGGPPVLSVQVFADADPKHNAWRGSVPHKDVTEDPTHSCWKGLEE